MSDKANILFKDEDEYNNASDGEVLEAGDRQYQKDNTGQIVIYTGIFFWSSDGSYRDKPEPVSEKEKDG